VLAAQVETLQSGSRQYDFELVLRNTSEAAIMVYVGEMNCYRSGRPGTLKREFYDTNERGLGFAPGEAKRLKFTCRHGEGVIGDFRIGVPKVYANLGAEGAPPAAGRVVARDLLIVTAAP
jgi:hypothetical protein